MLATQASALSPDSPARDSAAAAATASVAAAAAANVRPRAFFSSRRRHTRLSCDWVQTCALPILRRTPALRQFALGGGVSLLVIGFSETLDRKSVVEGKRGDLGGRPVIKKKKKKPTGHVHTGRGRALTWAYPRAWPSGY